MFPKCAFHGKVRVQLWYPKSGNETFAIFLHAALSWTKTLQVFFFMELHFLLENPIKTGGDD